MLEEISDLTCVPAAKTVMWGDMYTARIQFTTSEDKVTVGQQHISSVHMQESSQQVGKKTGRVFHQGTIRKVGTRYQ